MYNGLIVLTKHLCRFHPIHSRHLNIPATAFLWGYDSMGRPVDTLNLGYKNAQKALTKIEALTGLSLKNHKDLFTLELCLMITSPHLDTL